jgi:UDP-GlcNAc:undecaprenyl-phosphate/decaprenyl-phosphate GlcNAc-1-phosphate transferase
VGEVFNIGGTEEITINELAERIRDDLWKLRPTSKLVLQTLAGAMLISFGVYFSLTPWMPLDALLTLFWFIALTNALNLLDNMDGITAGVSGVGALFLGALFALEGEVALATVAVVLAGTTLGFLPYNFRPASIFMGDSGSLFLGATLAGLTVAYSGLVPANALAAAAVPILVVIVPLFDTTLVTVTRTRARYAITQGGRDHMAHRLVGMGLSESRVALLLYGLAAAGGLFAVILHRGASTGDGIWLAALFLVAMGVLGAYLSRLYTYAPEGAQPATRMQLLLEELLFKRRALEVVFDLVVFAVAYVGAYLLRYDAAVPPDQAALLYATIGLAVACKSVMFGVFGVYRGVWHRISLADVHRLLRASLLGTLVTVAVVVFAFRDAEFSRSVFVLDGLLATMLALGVRVSFRSLDQVQRSLRNGGRRALVYGAGKGGEVTVRELFANEEMQLDPVAFIDDDPNKAGCLIQGLPVAGSIESLEVLAERWGATQLVVSTRKLPEERWSELSRRCREAGLEMLALEIGFRGWVPPPVVELRQQAGL